MSGLWVDPPLWVSTDAQLGPRLLDSPTITREVRLRWWQVWWREAQIMWRILCRGGI